MSATLGCNETVEKELNHFLNFLGIILTVKHSRLLTNWHRKPTFSGRVLHCYSNHPTNRNRAMIYNVVSHTFHSEYLTIVTNVLLANIYPHSFVKLSIKNRLKKLFHLPLLIKAS